MLIAILLLRGHTGSRTMRGDEGDARRSLDVALEEALHSDEVDSVISELANDRREAVELFSEFQATIAQSR